MQQTGNAKVPFSSSGVLLYCSLVPASTSSVFLNSNISVNSSALGGSTFTGESATTQWRKVLLNTLAPSAMVYTSPNSGQTAGSMKQEDLKRSLVFS